MPLYLSILFWSALVPILFSIFFIDFIKHWKAFIISTTIVALVFLIWDAVFTSQGVWGFNQDYCVGLFIFKMPVEEWLFFFLIPFCSLFTHFAFFYALPNLHLPAIITKWLTYILMVLAILLVGFNLSKAYTAVNFLFLFITLFLAQKYGSHLLQQFYISFIIVLIPFFIVNGILTGATLSSPVVWYNDAHNLGWRLYTIPVEDIGYAFTMLFSNLLIFERLKTKWKTT